LLPGTAKARLDFASQVPQLIRVGNAAISDTFDILSADLDTFSFEILHTLQSVQYTNTPFLLGFPFSLLIVLLRYFRAI
jgi:hypothetical protein